MSAGDIFVTDADKRIRELEATIAHQIAGALAKQGDHIIEQERAIVGRDKRIAELESKLDESYDWWEAQEMLIDDYEATIAELREAASWSRDLLWRMQSGQVLDKYKVSPPQCTCVTDKEMTCIVHPTTRSLKEYIARLVAIADAAELVLINTDKLFSEHRELKALLEGE